MAENGVSTNDGELDIQEIYLLILLKILYCLHLYLATTARQGKFKMPPIRTSRNRKPPPAGFDDLEDTLLEFSNKMKDAENAPHDGKKKHEMLWPIFQISHQRAFHDLSPDRQVGDY